MLSYDPLHKHRRLWNDPENILSESLAGILMMHQNLVYVDSCNAVLRQDLDKLNGKVRIIGGGAVIDGLMYAGFVGPGMLTAAVLGLHGSSSSVPTSDSILEVINRVVKNDQQKASEVLLLVHDCPEYFLNFLEAKNKAESKGISVKVIYVRDDLNGKLNQKPSSSPRSPSGLLLVYKIAGAMSEDGNTLNEIYDACNEIIENKVIFTTGVYIAQPYSEEVAQIQITRGDILSDRDMKRFSLETFSTKKIIDFLIHDMISVDNCQKFPQGSKLAILLDYFGGFSELEANIVIKELVQQLNELNFKVRIIYKGAFHVSLELKGFHLSILNLSNNLKYLYYLSVPTSAFSWPKTNSREILLQMHNDHTNQTKKKTGNLKTENNDKTKSDKKITTSKGAYENDILLIAIEFACEALIACSKKIDMLDNPKIPRDIKKCGTRLANVAEAIKITISKKKFVGLSPSSILFQISCIFQKCVQDPQADLYCFFLYTIGKEIGNKKISEASDWLDVFVRVINSIDSIAKGTKFSNTLNAAKVGFCNAYAEDDDVIHALGQAVYAAQKETSHIVLESGKVPGHLINEKDYGFVGLAGAHAIGVWMRGAYEGIKLKYSNQEVSKKRKHSDDSASEDAVDKVPKLSDSSSSC